MPHKCFISFKTEDRKYKEYIQQSLNLDMVDKSLNEPIDSYDDNYIMRKIREDYLRDSTVTIFLIGEHSSENLGAHEQRFIKKELQASLYHGENNTRNGILGVVLPHMYDKVWTGSYTCSTCNGNHVGTNIYNTTIKEFSHNYFIQEFGKCSWHDDDRYCILVKWDDFVNQPQLYIDKAFDKRFSVISKKISVRP